MKYRFPIVAGLLLAIGACGRAPEPETTIPAPKSEAAPVSLPRTPSAEGARVFFITPADGATVSNPIAVEFGIEGMAVVKAGDDAPHSGHHHLLIDTALPNLTLPIPADERHIHFGDGSTATEITLSPGEHSLQMLLGDHLHVPHDPPLKSETITITVSE